MNPFSASALSLIALSLTAPAGIEASSSPARRGAEAASVEAASGARSEPRAPSAIQEAAPGAKAARFELPRGAAADAVARLVVGTVPARSTVDLGAAGRVPSVAVGAWSQAATWDTWAESIAAEVRAAERARAPEDSTKRDPKEVAADAAARTAARARLALLALEQDRSDDAWEHLAATTPEWTAALLPRFLPGVPPGALAGTGGASGRLDAGVVLSPALPPPSLERVAGRVDRRAMSVRDVAIGETVVSLRVSVEAEGVQVDVRHRSGPATRFAVRIPTSPDYEFGDEYVDWYRQDAKLVPHEIEVKPGEEEHTLYGRFDKHRDTPAAAVPARMPPALPIGGLWLCIASDDPEHELVAGVAAAMGRTGLGFRCGVRPPGVPSSGISGTTVDLSDRVGRAQKLAWLASAIEHFALAERAPR